MHKDPKRGVRITIERISVTTVSTRNSSRPVYCDICNQEIEKIHEISGREDRPLLGDGHTADPEPDK